MDRSSVESKFRETRSKLQQRFSDLDAPSRDRDIRERVTLLVRNGDMALMNFVAEEVKLGALESLMSTRDAAQQHEMRGFMLGIEDFFETALTRAADEAPRKGHSHQREPSLADLPSHRDGS